MLLAALVAAAPARAATVCTLIAEARPNGAVLLEDGPECSLRTSPASTFKIALALMGYDYGILDSPDAPVWSKPDDPSVTAGPREWMAQSLVWYSQLLTTQLGELRFSAYIRGFDYGNRNINGDPGRNNGLTNSWLSSSLRISPREQITFLRRVINRQLPLSNDVYVSTFAILPHFQAGDWSVTGKTGTGYQTGLRGELDRDRQFGWFVGWAEQGEKRVLFARLIKDEGPATPAAGLRARDALLAELPGLLASY